jgi:hypothetical protein
MTPPTVTIVPTGCDWPGGWYWEVTRRGICWGRGRTATEWGARREARRTIRRAKRKGASW